MSRAPEVIGGSPTAEEMAAVLAAVQVLLEAAVPTPDLPWPYRSAWRRKAIDEGVSPYAASTTALGRPMSHPPGDSNDLGGWGPYVASGDSNVLGERGPYVASTTALGRPMSRPSGDSSDLGDLGPDVS